VTRHQQNAPTPGAGHSIGQRGVGEARNRTRLAVERTVPFGLFTVRPWCGWQIGDDVAVRLFTPGAVGKYLVRLGGVEQEINR
jgi:hypothetical protein